MNARQCIGVILVVSVNILRAVSAEVVDSPAQKVPTPEATALSFPQMATCAFATPGAALSLLEAIERAMCFDPKTREAWAVVQQRAAEATVSKMAYLPTLNGTVSDGIARNSSASPDNAGFDASTHYKNPKAELDMALTLFDFGFRSATIRSAKAVLASAYALHDDALRGVVTQTMQAYYDLLRAVDAVQSDRELESNATRLHDAVNGRYRGGAALLTELLQAEASRADMELKRIVAEGDAEIAKGSLAVLMGLSVDTEFAVVDVSNDRPDAIDPQIVQELIQDALRNEPKIAAAVANLKAAEADLSAERARDMPTLAIAATSAFVGQSFLGQNDFSVYQNSANNTARTNQIALEISVPLTNLITRQYKIKSAEANILAKSRELDAAKQQVELAVWNAYQKWRASSQAIGVTAHMLETANDFYSASQGRYYAGAGSLIDVLNAQRDLETARIGHRSAVFDFQISRLTLLSSVGRLNLPRMQ